VEKLHNEELYDLYCSPNTIWAIKSRRIRWAGYVTHVRDRIHTYRALVGEFLWK
jgi:ribosomal protein S17E